MMTTITELAITGTGVGALVKLYRHLPGLTRAALGVLAREGRRTSRDLAAAALEELFATEPDEGKEWALEVEDDTARPWTAPVRDGLVAGRGARAGLRLSGVGVSRVHARFDVDADGGVSVVDLDSRNGLVVGGRRVRRAMLREGESVGLGRAVRVRLVRTPAL